MHGTTNGADTPVRSQISNAAIDTLIVSLGYFALAALTIAATSDGRNHATMWPADALVLAMLLRNPRANVTLTLIAGWAANLAANTWLRQWSPGLIAYGAINMGQVWLAARLIKRFNPTNLLLANATSALRFVMSAGIVAPALAGVLGSLVTWSVYRIAFAPAFVSWYISNALGLLIFGPFFLALLNRVFAPRQRPRRVSSQIEAIAMQLLHFGVTCVVFWQNSLPLLFIPSSIQVILAFRLGRLGAVIGVTTIGVVGAVATYFGHGPTALIAEADAYREFFLQFFLAVVLAASLPVAAAASSRAETLSQLAEREEALHLMMRHAPDGILSFDLDGKCRWADGALLNLVGVDPPAMIGRSLASLSIRADELARRAHAAPPHRQVELIAVEFTPPLRPHLTVEASLGLLLENREPVGTVVNLRDVTERKAAERVILSRAQTDELTGLMNRYGFRKHLQMVLADPEKPTTLVLFDIDNFKEINDRHGHAIGDEVLVAIARHFKSAMRTQDVAVRLGGDEFAALLSCDAPTAERICERILNEIRAHPIHSDDHGPIHVTLSCGIAQYESQLDHDQVFEAADAALYEVKRSGRNAVRSSTHH